MNIFERKATSFAVVRSSLLSLTCIVWISPQGALGQDSFRISSSLEHPSPLEHPVVPTERANSTFDSSSLDVTFKSVQAKPLTKDKKDTGSGITDKSALLYKKNSLLKGTVSVTGKPSLLLEGSVQSIPRGVSVDITLLGNINSEVSQKGDDVWVRIAHDVKSDSAVLLPGQWYMHGAVTDVASQRRLGRDGYVELEFDKLVSPDGETELPFKAKLSTKDKLLKSVAKTMAIDSAYLAQGACGGALLSAQLTGIPLAIASHGYSIAIGAGVGATLGAIGALKRKGQVASIYPGDELKLTTAEPIVLPCFDIRYLPSSRPAPALRDLDVSVHSFKFGKDPLGDKKARMLFLDVSLDNKTKRAYSFFDLAVVSDHNQRYYPSFGNDFRLLARKIEPQSALKGTVSFSVDSPEHKYWLVLLDRVNKDELYRVPIN